MKIDIEKQKLQDIKEEKAWKKKYGTTLRRYFFKAKMTKKCKNCGEKNAPVVRRECGTWGRKIRLCKECIENGK
jgi:ribosomal protein L32